MPQKLDHPPVRESIFVVIRYHFPEKDALWTEDDAGWANRAFFDLEQAKEYWLGIEIDEYKDEHSLWNSWGCCYDRGYFEALQNEKTPLQFLHFLLEVGLVKPSDFKKTRIKHLPTTDEDANKCLLDIELPGKRKIDDKYWRELVLDWCSFRYTGIIEIPLGLNSESNFGDWTP